MTSDDFYIFFLTIHGRFIRFLWSEYIVDVNEKREKWQQQKPLKRLQFPEVCVSLTMLFMFFVCSLSAGGGPDLHTNYSRSLCELKTGMTMNNNDDGRFKNHFVFRQHQLTIFIYKNFIIKKCFCFSCHF